MAEVRELRVGIRLAVAVLLLGWLAGSIEERPAARDVDVTNECRPAAVEPSV